MAVRDDDPQWRNAGTAGVRLDTPRLVSGRPMFVVIKPSRSERKPLATGGYMAAPYEAVVSDDQVEVTMTVDVIDGAVACTAYTVRSVDGVGLENRTTEVFRGLKLRDALAAVVAVVPPRGADFDTAAAIASAAGFSVRRTRRPVDDDRLREVAQLYRERYRPGAAAEFAASISASERQMWRLIKLARERGFLPEGDSK